MTPMATTGEEAVGSMGNDTPISALSDKPKLLFTYFKQNFAQVTNPPIDPIREELVMSLVSIIGPRPNLFDLEGTVEHQAPRSAPADPHQRGPGEDPLDLRGRRRPFQVALRSTPPSRPSTAPPGMKDALDALCARAEAAVRDGINIIILSDRRAGADRIPIPSLLACAAVHHHLIRQGLRTSVGLVVESGEPREVHHFACLAGYGAEAINPYLAFETLIAMKDDLPQKLDEKEIVKRYIKSIDKGLLKVMSKMGISTYQSYCGAQIFDAVGLKSDFVAEYFTGTATRIEGVGLQQIAEETRAPPSRRLRRLRRSIATRSTSAANIRSACAARTMSGPPQTVVGAAARRARQLARPVSRLRQDLERAVRAAAHHPRPVPHQDRRGGRPQAGADRGGRAGQGHRAALLDRRHVVRLDLARGAYHARDRHEPHRRQVEHRRRRRGSRPLQAAAERRLDALGDQAGGVGPLRRDHRISRQLRHDADQDGAGRQARRRRPVARPQGRRDHRQGAPLDARRRPDLAAAASRHLFDRGSGAAHLRPQERQSRRPACR